MNVIYKMKRNRIYCEQNVNRREDKSFIVIKI